METLNLGVLAHVDAGKTSLTERILFTTGVIATAGRVDHGTTQTDSLALERQRGITIQTAVASFRLGGLAVNLVDTPGHADFIAEVDRALQVLDAVILVISAVDGVQPQTRRLARAIRQAGLPLLCFINKLDQLGARGLDLVPEVAAALDLPLVALGEPVGQGTRAAAFAPYPLGGRGAPAALLDRVAAVDDDVLASFLEHDGDVPADVLAPALWAAVRRGEAVPVWFGSAMTGAGVDNLLASLPDFWSAAGTQLGDDRPGPGGRASAAGGADRHDAPGDHGTGSGGAAEPLAALVFKVQQAGPTAVALARVFAGTVTVRDEIVHRQPPRDAGFGRDDDWVVTRARVTGLDEFTGGQATPARRAGPGMIVRVHGLREPRVGDVLGEVPAARRPPRFPAPTMESVLLPAPGTDRLRLNAALRQLEAQDPLISVRHGQRVGDDLLSVRLYGEVQKEVIQALLRDDFGVEVGFGPSQTLCIERVAGSGAAREAIGEPENPFWATLGFRVSADPGDGIVYERELGLLPLPSYRGVEETIHATLEEGLLGWPVRGARVELTDAGFSSVMSTVGDFRKLTPLVLMAALQAAGTVVCEPLARFVATLPEVALPGFYRLLHDGAGVATGTGLAGPLHEISGELPAAAVEACERAFPALTSGQGSFLTEPAGFRPVAGAPPSRPRTDCDPLHRKKYLALVSQQ